MEKGAKKFLALVSFAGLASSMGVTSGVYAANEKQQDSAAALYELKDGNSIDSVKNLFDVVKFGDKDYYKMKENLSDEDYKKANDALGGFTEHYFGKEQGKIGNANASVFYELKDGNSIDSVKNLFDVVKVGDKDYYKMKENLSDEDHKKANDALGGFTPYYFYQARGANDGQEQPGAQDSKVVFYAIDPSKLPNSWELYFDKTRIAGNDYFQKKDKLGEEATKAANETLANSTAYYFGKDLNEVVNVNGFSKRDTAFIAGGAALVAAGTALAIREFVAGSNDVEDSE